MESDCKDQVLQLMNKRDMIEKEIKEMGLILSQNGVGLNDPLVDDEGFPLSNIDIYQVRFARNRIICLQNDHKAIMKEIENGLGQYYSTTRENSSTSVSGTVSQQDYSKFQPFVKVSNVVSGSPADEAGLQNGDSVIEFGSVNANNFKDINMIADVVRHSENSELTLRVRRDSRVVPVRLRPRKWMGKGLLGCLIAPIDTPER